MSWEGIDRRKFPRVLYPCLVKVISADRRQEALLTHTENIGMGGLSVTVKHEIKLFTPMEMEVDLLDLEEHITPKGKVVWNVRRKSIEEIKPMFYDIGIEFTEISKKDHERLRENLQRLIEKGVKVSKPFI
ncbi:MAG: PilZ domain-containing protein [Candidatus Omnitrophica bacterium]|nr:PilZ domain-containing protein [Candidatus Omnitrophota bacterium]MDE2009563.1 PilZ domain-containing protein [Candidatus Omnitrophota bacterium]MDE2214607.1 PilZ domain-containing protein [Candidatus Omnitrophota bacterium]MDE2231684.1 PilZ domain-containing protein [Candidatus Omnitrophota bacterium]